MRVLLLGGTGLISVGILKHLAARGADITVFNRGKRDASRLPKGVRQLVGDRNEIETFERRFASEHFDCVIDMIAFSPSQAMSDVRAFGGRCTHFIFCSTVCTYGVKIPSHVVIDESFPQEPASDYGRNKLACERIILDAQRGGAFMATVIRPSSTYGLGSPLIDQLEFDPIAWDRITRGEPVLVADGGLGLWNSTHRDDVGKLFAYAAMNAKTYGKCYNATTERVFTWRDYYREAAAALGTTAKLISVPADLIVSRDAKRFNLLAEITRYHGPYTSAAATADVPEFTCEIDFRQGAKETLEDVKRRGAWKSGSDPMYEGIVKDALAMGLTPVEA